MPTCWHSLLQRTGRKIDAIHEKKRRHGRAHLYVSNVQQLLRPGGLPGAHEQNPRHQEGRQDPRKTQRSGQQDPSLTLLLPLDEEDQKTHANVNYREKGKGGERAPPRPIRPICTIYRTLKLQNHQRLLYLLKTAAKALLCGWCAAGP